MYDKWAERFSRLEATFLAKSFTVPIEPVQKSVVTVTGRPFIPPVQQPTGATGQKQPTSEKETQIVTQPVEAPAAVDVSGPVIATQPVEAPGAGEMTQTGQDASLHPAADRPEVQPPGPASQMSCSGQSEVHPPDPTGLPATVSKRCSSVLAGATVPVEDPVPEGGYVSDRASSQADEGRSLI